MFEKSVITKPISEYTILEDSWMKNFLHRIPASFFSLQGYYQSFGKNEPVLSHTGFLHFLFPLI